MKQVKHRKLAKNVGQKTIINNNHLSIIKWFEKTTHIVNL